VLRLDEVVVFLDRRQPPPRRSVVITFDDGYEETPRIAWPLLKRFGFPATIFVTPTEVGLPGFATWDQLVEIARDGAAIGSHTMHHTYLPLVNADRLPEEIIQSKRIIEERVGCPVHFLSYPVGGFTPEAQALVKQAGYLAACTTNRAFSMNGDDRFALRRIKVTERDGSSLLFLAKVSGYYDMFRQLKHPA
jgi:peptidoglycan/xylan/chitin deacetylase (PgdA/CDA1 family)